MGTETKIADDLRGLFRRFISAGEPELIVLPLWVLHTHAFAGVSHYTPYLAITSAEKQSGKTRVLELLKHVAREPLITASISPAALARTVHQSQPTLLLDEMDALLRGNQELSEAVRGILNSGFQSDGTFTRMTGIGPAMKPEHFSTFSPKAMAGIGNLPDTVSDRSITIRLERAPRGQCEKFRPKGMGSKAKQLNGELQALRNRASEWAKQNVKALADAEPVCPAELSDRQQDISEPLLAIADAIGGDWPARARASLIALFTSTAAEDTSHRTRLLADIKGIFDNSVADKFKSEDLAQKLAEIETSPWGEWKNGKPMTPRGLATQLKPFHVFPRTIRLDYETKKGYLREDFEPLWKRYVSPCYGSCDGSKTAVSANVYAGCDGVTDISGGNGQSA